MKYAMAALILAMSATAHAADRDGRYAQSPLKPWFDTLRSSKGLCCSITDGFSIADVDWTVDAGRYRVRVEGQWIDVPDDALVTVPNKYGPPMVWPLKDVNGTTTIRCFMPGTLA
jgi:hypothetical protein